MPSRPLCVNELKASVLCVTSDCPACYDWVQQQVRVVRQQLLALNEIVTYVLTQPPQQINDTEYIDQLVAVNDSVQQLWNDASVHGNICQFLLFIIRPSCKPHYASCPSVCLSVRFIRARNGKTKKHRKTKIGVDVPEGTS